MGTPVGRGILAATVLGSGIAFLDSTVVNVALPAIAEDLDTDTAALQWTVDAYLVTLTALLLLGGAVGDRYGRRKTFIAGLIAFTVASVACAAAPTSGVLAIGRAVQGVGGAFLVPGSLAIIGATFAEDQRSRAIGAWSGLAGVSQCDRSVHRRLAGRCGVVALRVLHQPPARGRRRGRDAEVRAGDQGTDRDPARRPGCVPGVARSRRRVLGAHRAAGGSRSPRCRVARRVRARRGAQHAPDAAARAVQEPAVHGREPDDAGRVRRARRRNVLPGAAAPARARLLGARSRCVTLARNDPHAACCRHAPAPSRSGSGRGSR